MFANWVRAKRSWLAWNFYDKIARNAKNAMNAMNAKNAEKAKTAKNAKKCKKCKDCLGCQDCRYYRDCQDCRDRWGCQDCQHCRDWNSKISQNVQNLGLFEKTDGFLRKKLDFFKFAEGGKISVECVSICKFLKNWLFRPSFEVSCQKNRTPWTLEKLEITMNKKCFFVKKIVFLF